MLLRRPEGEFDHIGIKKGTIDPKYIDTYLAGPKKTRKRKQAEITEMSTVKKKKDDTEKQMIDAELNKLPLTDLRHPHPEDALLPVGAWVASRRDDGRLCMFQKAKKMRDHPPQEDSGDDEPAPVPGPAQRPPKAAQKVATGGVKCP